MNKRVYKTAMYLRLSKGDDDLKTSGKVQSNSIDSQKLIIGNFIEAHDDLELVDCFIDDGHTGLNFDRNAFKEMMKKVDVGEIDCIVVKDNSRLGRDRIVTTEFISKTFEEKGVRFISINDNYDSLTAGSSDKNLIMPITNLFNDNYSKDISNKVKASKQAKWNNGDFMGAFAPYGYKKDSKNKNHLVPDDDAAKVVQEIYAKKISGMSGNAIANYLNEMGVLSPGDYKKSKGINYQSGFKNKAHSKWSCKVVLGILADEVYIGNLVQGKRRKVNYKLKKEIVVPENERIRVEGTHEPIITKSDYELVQQLLVRDTMTSKNKYENLYGGLLFCGDCGFSMVRRKNYHKGKQYVRYICSNYNRNGSDKCSRHSISEPIITSIVTSELNLLFKRVNNINNLIEKLKERQVDTDTIVSRNKEYQRLQNEIKRISALRETLYQDFNAGLLKQEQFESYRKIYIEQEKELKSAISKHRDTIEKVYEKGIQCDYRLESLKDVNRRSINRVLLVTFIDKILIFEDNQIEIHFKIADELDAMADLREVL